MNPSELEFLKKAQSLGYLDQNKIKLLLEEQKQKALPLYSLLLKEKIMSIDQISLTQKSVSTQKSVLQEKQSHSLSDPKTVSQEQKPQAVSLNTQKTVQQKATIEEQSGLLSLDKEKTLFQDTACPEDKENHPGSSIPAQKKEESSLAKEGKESKKFGRYTILSQLGEGGMGVVYKAYDPGLDRPVAIKVITSTRQQSKISIERFQIEARATASLKNPYIINIYDIGVEKDLYFFTMDFIDGDTLENLIKNKQLGRQNALKLMVKICKGMAYAHSQNVIHRDLKPANIMIDKNGEPKIMDFGLAKMGKMDKKLSQTGALLGTPVYMSPEQAAGKELDSRSDVYSLGAIFYKILTGIEPFHSDKLVKILEKVIHEEPIPPSRVKPNTPRDLEIICQKAMAKDPARRYSSAMEFAEDIERFLEGDPIQARPVSFFYKSYCKLYKHKIITLSSILFLILLAGVTFFSESRFRKDRQKRLQKTESLASQHISKAQSISKSLDSLHSSQKNIEKNSVLLFHQAMRELSQAIDILSSSESRDSFVSTIQDLKDQNQRLLNAILQDAAFYYEKKLCNQSQSRYQSIKSLLYSFTGESYSQIQQKIDQELDKLYAFQWKSQELNERAKLVFYQNDASLQDRQSSIQILQESLNNNRENPETFYLLGRLYYQLLDYSNAIKNFQECNALQENHFASQYYLVKNKAKEYLSSKEKQVALKFYLQKYEKEVQENEKKLYTGEQKAYFSLLQAWSFMFEQKRIQAQEKCREAIKHNELLAEAYYLHANFLTYFLKDEQEIKMEAIHGLESMSIYYSLEEAMQSLKRAMSLEKYNPLGYVIQGKISFDLFCFSEAVEKFTFVIERNPSAYVYWFRGLSYLGMDQKHKALEDFEKIRNDYKITSYWMDCTMYCLYSALGQQEKTASFIQTWKKENPIESIKKYFEIPFDDTLKEKFTVMDSFPVLCLALFAQYEVEEDTKKYYSKSQAKDFIHLKTLFPDSSKLASYLNCVDDFRLIEDSYHLMIKSFLVQYRLEDLGAAPLDLHYAFLFKAMCDHNQQNPKVLKSINLVAQKAMEISADIAMGFATRGVVTRYRNILFRQEGIENSDFYYQRAMLSYIQKKYEETLEDLRLAEHFSPQSSKVHYAISKIAACLYTKNTKEKQKQDLYLKTCLYHLEQAFLYGWDNGEAPLKDYHFQGIADKVRQVWNKYHAVLPIQQWEKLWNARKEKRYGETLEISSSLPGEFVSFQEQLEKEHQLYYSFLLSRFRSFQRTQELLPILKKGDLTPSLHEKLEGNQNKLLKAKNKKILVNMEGKGDFSSLNEAIEFANYGTTILLSPGTYEGNFILKSGISLQPANEPKGEEKECILKGGIALTAVNVSNSSVQGLKIWGSVVIHNSEIRFQNNECIKERPGVPRAFRITGASEVQLYENKITGHILCFNNSRLHSQKNKIVFTPNLGGFSCVDLRDESIATIEECSISQGRWGGISLFHQTEATIKKNTIFNNTTHGIQILNKAKAKIIENDLHSQEIAIKLEDQAQAQIDKNTIHKNDLGVQYTSQTNCLIGENAFYENRKKDVQKAE